jgi:TPR repeat protein
MSALRITAACLLLAVACGAAEPVPSAALQAAAQLLRQGDVQGARAAYRELAEAGDRRAQQVLAGMLLDGVGGAADRPRAMHWLCRLAHHRDGGPEVLRAAWYLAEYFRTGGGLPGQRYNDGERAAENPIKAYFWFGVLAGQARYYARTDASARTLGELGMSRVGDQLYDGERQQVERALERWAPLDAASRGARCLDLPLP